MTYHLDPRNPLVEEVRLVARNQIDRALRSAAGAEGDRVEAVHDLRKRMKKLRALLRLVRPGLGETYAAENRAFRDIARPLSPIRDAQVLSETVAKLREGSRASANLRPLADWADARQTRAIEGVDLPQMLETARQEIAAARARVAGWTLDGESRKVLGKGLGKTYGRARKLHRTAADSRDARDLHEWRKRVKYHWYHVRLLRDGWPEAMAVRTDALDTLSECLGDDHDLWVLQQTAAADDAAPHEGLEHARPLIEARREALQAHALALAPRLLVENKGALRTRLASYFVTAARLDAP